MGISKREIFKSPGELLAFERKHLISRQGYDFDFDLSQYFKVSAGEKIVIVSNAFLFWRNHKNQSHIFLKFNSSHLTRVTQIYYATDIYNLHRKIYGATWAKSINYYYKYSRIVKLVSKNFIID